MRGSPEETAGSVGCRMRLSHPDPAAGLRGMRAMKTIASSAGPIGRSPARGDGGGEEGDPAPRCRHRCAAADHAGRAGGELPGARAAAAIHRWRAGDLARRTACRRPRRWPRSRRSPRRSASTRLRSPTCAALAEHHMLVFKIDFLRRSQIAGIMKNQLEQKGPLGLVKSVLTMRGVMEDRALAARYR